MVDQDSPKQKQPETYREIMLNELKKRKKLFLDSELEQIDLSPNQLVEMLAKALADKECSKPGIDTSLESTSVARILKDTLGLAEIIRSELGPLRRENIENDARAILRGDVDPGKPEAGEKSRDAFLSVAEAEAAVKAVDTHDRRDIAGSFTRTNKECAQHLAKLAYAHHDRLHGAAEPEEPLMPEKEAQLRGPARTETFYRAVDPSTGDADIAAIIGPALTELPAIDRRLRQSKNLAEQLTSRKMLLAGQESQLEAEASIRRHFPFGLIRPGSLAIVAAAIYLMRAQAADSIIRAARARTVNVQDPAVMFTKTFNNLSLEVARKSASDESKGWETYYDATPGALDCLRAAVPLISTGQVPAFLGVPPSSRPIPNPDPAHRLIHAALPLDEPGEASWAHTRWNPVGQRLLHLINKEHYVQKKHALFHDGDFKLTAGRVPGLVLTELIHRLQRAEGLICGLPNTRKTYVHSSILSLNRFLSTILDKPFKMAFRDYRLTVLGIRSGNPQLAAVGAGPAVSVPEDVPRGVTLLTMDSVRNSMEKLLSSVEEHDWAYTQFEDPSALPAQALRTAAGEMLELANWAEINEALLTEMSLDEILHAYHDQHEAIGNPPPEPDDAALLRALIFDTVLTDSTVTDLLKNLTTTDGEQKETGNDH